MSTTSSEVVPLRVIGPKTPVGLAVALEDRLTDDRHRPSVAQTEERPLQVRAFRGSQPTSVKYFFYLICLCTSQASFSAVLVAMDIVTSWLSLKTGGPLTR